MKCFRERLDAKPAWWDHRKSPRVLVGGFQPGIRFPWFILTDWGCVLQLWEMVVFFVSRYPGLGHFHSTLMVIDAVGNSLFYLSFLPV